MINANNIEMIEHIEFHKNICIFDFKFNKEITAEIIDECITRNIKKIIFNNYNDVHIMFKKSNDFKGDHEHNKHWRGNRFNKSIGELNKIDLEHLVLGAKFNEHVGNLPSFLVSLILGIEFDKPLNNLPNTLKILSCKNCIKYSHDLDYLPESLEYIAIPPDFNKSLNNLPQNIRILDFNTIYDSSLILNNISILPSNLEIILLDIKDKTDLNLINNHFNKYSKIIKIEHNSYNCFDKVIS